VFRFVLAVALNLVPLPLLAGIPSAQVCSTFDQLLGVDGASLTLRCTVSWDESIDACALLPPAFRSPDGLDVISVSSLAETDSDAGEGRHRLSETFLVYLKPTRTGVVDTGAGEIRCPSGEGSREDVLLVPSASIRVVSLPLALLVVLAFMCAVLVVPLVLAVWHARRRFRATPGL